MGGEDLPGELPVRAPAKGSTGETDIVNAASGTHDGVKDFESSCHLGDSRTSWRCSPTGCEQTACKGEGDDAYTSGESSTWVEAISGTSP